MAIRLSREVWPETISTSDLLTPRASARNSTTALLALPLSGAAETAILSAPAYSPRTRVRDAPGETRTENTGRPSLSSTFTMSGTRSTRTLFHRSNRLHSAAYGRNRKKAKLSLTQRHEATKKGRMVLRLSTFGLRKDKEAFIHRFHRLHRLSPEPNSILASPRAAFAGGCQELGDLRTEAAKRNNVAKATILHACSTETEEVRHGPRPSPGSVFSVASVVSLIAVVELPGVFCTRGPFEYNHAPC